VYVCAYDADGTTSHPMRVSSGGGVAPRWAGDGKSLLYIATGGRLMSVPVSATPAITTGPPVQLLDLSRLRIAEFSALPDGRLLGILTSELERVEITDEN